MINTYLFQLFHVLFEQLWIGLALKLSAYLLQSSLYITFQSFAIDSTTSTYSSVCSSWEVISYSTGGFIFKQEIRE